MATFARKATANKIKTHPMKGRSIVGDGWSISGAAICSVLVFSRRPRINRSVLALTADRP